MSDFKIVFADNDRQDYEDFLKLPFAKEHLDSIMYLDSLIRLPKVIRENKKLRLVILDMLWESLVPEEGKPHGADALKELPIECQNVVVVIHSNMEEEERLEPLFFEMLRSGATDWVSKQEPAYSRSLRLKRAFDTGRTVRENPLSHVVLGGPEPEREDVFVACLFVDMCGFTALTDRLSRPQMNMLLNEFYALVNSAALEYGGYVDQFLGDAALVFFGARDIPAKNPIQVVNDCVNAAEAISASALKFKQDYVDPEVSAENLRFSPEEIRKLGLLRTGIESGLVNILRFERGNEIELAFTGTCVNIASRILDKITNGNETWIGDNALQFLTRRHPIIKEEEVEYKNLPGKFTMHRIK